MVDSAVYVTSHHDIMGGERKDELEREWVWLNLMYPNICMDGPGKVMKDRSQGSQSASCEFK
jgi:hypothetical protein